MISICAQPGVRDLDQLKIYKFNILHFLGHFCEHIPYFIHLKTAFGLFKILLFLHLCNIIPGRFK